MPVTTSEIAKTLGLSRQTVSYALNGGKGRVSPELRRRIEATSRELGYRPNAVANAMRTGRFGSLGLVATTLQHHSYLPGPLMEGVHQAINESNLHLVTARVPNDDLIDAEKAPKLLRELLVDGLLINYTHDIPEAIRALILRQNLPAVWLNADLPSGAVRPDDQGAGRQATELLLAEGHTRVLYLDAVHQRRDIVQKHAHYSVSHRYQGYTEAMQSVGLEPTLVAVDDLGTKANKVDAAAVRTLLDGQDRPTAVVTYSEAGVVSLLLAAASRGLSAPEDLAIAAITDRRLDLAELPVHSVLLPFAEMGRLGVELLHEQIAGRIAGEFPTRVLACAHVIFDPSRRSGRSPDSAR